MSEDEEKNNNKGGPHRISNFSETLNLRKQRIHWQPETRAWDRVASGVSVLDVVHIHLSSFYYISLIQQGQREAAGQLFRRLFESSEHHDSRSGSISGTGIPGVAGDSTKGCVSRQGVRGELPSLLSTRDGQLEVKTDVSSRN